MNQSNTKKIVNLFKYNALLAIILTAITISFLISLHEYIEYSHNIESIETEYVKEQKYTVKQEVEKVINYLNLKRSQIEQKTKERIKAKVYDAHTIASNIYKKFKNKLPDKEIKKIIIETLRSMRFFDGNGYYYITSMKGISQLHPLRPGIEGRKITDVQSPSGRFVAKEMCDLVKKSQEGFIKYQYLSFQNKNKRAPKISFVKYFKPYDWHIGSGDYLETIEKNIQNEMLAYIKQVSFGKNGYLYVLSYQGKMLMHGADDELIGKDIWERQDINGVKIAKVQREKVKNSNGGFVNSVWKNPASSSLSPKVTFVKAVDEWQWMVGAGFYVNDVQGFIQEQKQILKEDIIKQIGLIILTIVVISLIIIYAASRFSKNLSNEVNLFFEFFSNMIMHSNKINISSLRYAEFKELAISANQMLDSKIEIEGERNKIEESLRKSEKSLKEAQRIARYGSWEYDFVNDELFWSDEVYKIIEFDPEEHLSSYKLFLELIHPEDRAFADKSYKDSVKNKTPYDIEHRILFSDGRIKRVREYGETFYNDEGTPMRSTGTIQDITELREKEEQLKRSQKMDALGNLTGGIAHDYNNMLGIVLGYTEILQLKLDDDECLKYVDQIQKAGERGRKLTDKLMTFSRYQASKSEAVDINTELEEQQSLFEKTLTARIQLIMDLTNELWPVQLDKGDFNDAIINMIINSSHAIENNGELIIKSSNQHLDYEQANIIDLSEGDYVTLSIKDTGAGINEQTINKIFDPFFSTKGEKGTGLGMSQVYGFVQRSKGNIIVKSELGVGTEFILYFPKYYSDNTFKKDDLNQGLTISGNGNILVVDDDVLLAEMACEILTADGYDVISTTSAKQALELLITEKVDLVFSDIVMPGMNGYEFAAEVRKNYPDIKIQLTSGYNNVIDINDDEELLKIDILKKPYLSKDLISRVHGLMTKH